MKLIIDRAQTKSGIYSVSFGPDFDILIFREEFYLPSINKEIMSEVDRIITNSPNLVFCVTHIKHPLLIENCNPNDFSTRQGFFENIDEIIFRKKLRDYFAIRLIHRRYPVELYDFGKRLFKD
jgi:hypothetical protein